MIENVNRNNRINCMKKLVQFFLETFKRILIGVYTKKKGFRIENDSTYVYKMNRRNKVFCN